MNTGTAFDMIKTTDCLILPVLPHAMRIEQQFGNFLLPEKPGLYKLGDMEPCIIANNYYRACKEVRGGKNIISDITDFNSITDHIIDEEGKIVIPAYMMRDKQRYLSNTPSVPARSILIIGYMIEKYISDTSDLDKRSNVEGKIFNLIQPNHTFIYTDFHLETICRMLFTQVSNFIGNDTWHIYYTKKIGVDIMVEKTIDWRVFHYHQQLEIKNEVSDY